MTPTACARDLHPARTYNPTSQEDTMTASDQLASGATHQFTRKDDFCNHFDGFSVGDLCRDQHESYWTVVDVERHYYWDDDDEYHGARWVAHVRPATDDEAAVVTTHREAKAAHEAAIEAREAALTELYAMPLEDVDQVPSSDARVTVALSSTKHRGHVHSPPRYDAYFIGDDVYLETYDPMWDARNSTRRVTGDAAKAEALARAAAWEIREGGKVTWTMPEAPECPRVVRVYG